MSDAEGVAQDMLRSFVERIERLEEEKKTIVDDVKDVFAEAKGNGFDTKVLRRVIALRRQDQDERREQAAILDLYLEALGMIPAGPVQTRMEGDDLAPVRRADRPKSGREEAEAAWREAGRPSIETTIQLFDADRRPLTPKMSTKEFGKAGRTVATIIAPGFHQ